MTTIPITRKGLEKAKNNFEKTAQEELEVQFWSGAFWCFGTELACRRLEYAYRDSTDDTMFGYSPNRKTWYFGKETTSFTGEIYA